MICHRRKDIEALGYVFAGLSVTDPAPHRMRELHDLLDVRYGSLVAFRVAPDDWEVFYTPDRVDGFVEEPLLPPDHNPET